MATGGSPRSSAPIIGMYAAYSTAADNASTTPAGCSDAAPGAPTMTKMPAIESASAKSRMGVSGSECRKRVMTATHAG
ncbi:hypothetical protein D3C83_83790 [compost metagenome]